MELKHHFTVPASLQETWESFNRLEEIAPCFPGATLTSVTGDEFTGTVKVKLGPIAMLYSGTGEFLSREEATHTVVISAAGKDKRGNGTAGATVTAVMTAAGEHTDVDVTTDMNVTGKPAQFGRGVIQDVSDKLLAQFVQCVVKNASAEPDPGVAAAPGSPGPAGDRGPAAAALEPEGGDGAGESRGETAPAPTSAMRPEPASAPELDLGSAVWPVLARRFGPALLGALALLALFAWLARRRR
ncbi:SRPBCC domain-containing protein [Specibacter sp. RAF43]|uniref:SRPBCC family protein n=1 Tax=Specibacter sp. RAF43 TaxID=3233057 RepID=UPI003F9B381A